MFRGHNRQTAGKLLCLDPAPAAVGVMVSAARWNVQWLGRSLCPDLLVAEAVPSAVECCRDIDTCVAGLHCHGQALPPLQHQ